MVKKVDVAKDQELTMKEAVDRMQQELSGRISTLEKSVEDIQQQLRRLSVLDRVEEMMNQGNFHIAASGQAMMEETPERDAGVRLMGSLRQKEGSRGLSTDVRNLVPGFDGKNVDGWILRLELYFELGELTDEEKLKVARLRLDGEALEWYIWENKRNPFQSWKHMRERLIINFSPRGSTTPEERLLTLCQEGTVREFSRKFKILAAQSTDIGESVLEKLYLIGLQPAIRAGVKMFEPNSLDRIMVVAERVEEWAQYRSVP